jgi:hypothetical protein
MPERDQTHHAECWRDPKHRHCAEREIVRLRYLLAKHGGWVYYREEDPANPIRRDRTSRMGRTPPGKYVEVCRLCGAYRYVGHTAECEIGQALGITPEPAA